MVLGDHDKQGSVHPDESDAGNAKTNKYSKRQQQKKANKQKQSPSVCGWADRLSPKHWVFSGSNDLVCEQVEGIQWAFGAQKSPSQ